jgi:hypothetical protein
MKSHQEIMPPMRHTCLGALFSARALALSVLLLGGCMSDGECSRTSDCGAGLVCVHWDGGSEQSTFCAKQCGLEQDTCDTGEACGCPGSPSKQRCFDDKGERIGVCGR